MCLGHPVVCLGLNTDRCITCLRPWYLIVERSYLCQHNGHCFFIYCLGQSDVGQLMKTKMPEINMFLNNLFFTFCYFQKSVYISISCRIIIYIIKNSLDNWMIQISE